MKPDGDAAEIKARAARWSLNNVGQVIEAMQFVEHYDSRRFLGGSDPLGVGYESYLLSQRVNALDGMDVVRGLAEAEGIEHFCEGGWMLMRRMRGALIKRGILPTAVNAMSVAEFASAWLGEETTGGGSASRITVDLRKNTVTIDGQSSPVSGDMAILLNALAQADGDYVAAGTIVNRPDRLLKAAPQAVQDVVERTNNGYRLRLPELTNTPT